jgi:hypothetical protein
VERRAETFTTVRSANILISGRRYARYGAGGYAAIRWRIAPGPNTWVSSWRSIIANGTPLISRTGSLFRKVAGRG